MLASCDSGITGNSLENRPPDTELSIRDNSLVDNLTEAERLSSTVNISWSGTDPDGFVSAFEVRFYDSNEPAPANWTRTTSSDSLVLLPIPPGDRSANVVFEVRAIDDLELADPTPAVTVFPIRNSPPSIRLSSFDLPADTTFQVISFGWNASDPDGESNLAAIEVSLNDSVNYTQLPADFNFATLVGQVDPNDDTQTSTTANVLLGRGSQSSDIQIPNLLLDQDNTLYIRAVDLTDTTSVIERHSFFVKKQRSDILFVNDWRKSNSNILQAFHTELLASYLPAGYEVDIWDISQPWVTGSSGLAQRSDLMPANADPTLIETLALYRYIYWVSTNTTDNIVRNNFPYAAGALEQFFASGGKLMMHSPISLPLNAEDNLGNPALLLLPINSLISFPDTLRTQLRLRPGAAVSAINQVPGTATPLPDLTFSTFFINSLPYVVEGANTIPLYDATFTYVSRDNNQGEWTGASTIASISADRRIGLFALPIINEQSSEVILLGENDDPNAATRAVHLMLESLGFPR